MCILQVNASEICQSSAISNMNLLHNRMGEGFLRKGIAGQKSGHYFMLISLAITVLRELHKKYKYYTHRVPVSG